MFSCHCSVPRDKRGVYVAIHSNRYPLYKVLYDVLIEEEPHEWIDKEIIGALKEVSPMIIVAL